MVELCRTHTKNILCIIYVLSAAVNTQIIQKVVRMENLIIYFGNLKKCYYKVYLLMYPPI